MGFLMTIITLLLGWLMTTTETGGEGADTSATDAAQGNNAGSGGQDAPVDPRIKKLSDEAASYRNKAKAAAEEAAKLKAELEEAQRKRAETETAHQVREALLMNAARQNFNDPADALKFVDLTAIMQQADPEKRAAAIEEALGKLATERAYLVKAAPAPVDSGSSKGGSISPANPANAPTLTMEQIKTMTAEQINASWAEVQRVLAASKS